MSGMDNLSNSTSPAAKQRPHALVLSMPAQGHINPMLHFSLQLAARGGFIITFVNTEKAHRRMLEAHSERSPGNVNGTLGVDIRFVCIPDGTQQPLPGHGQPAGARAAMLQIVEGMGAQQGLLEAMVVESRATPHPITCFIADAFPWAHDLARRLGLKSVMLWTSSAATLAVVAEMRTGKLKPDDVEATPNEAKPAGLPLSLAQIRSALPMLDDPERRRFFLARFDDCEKAACIVVNTFQDLEAPSLHVASGALPTPIRHVGPLLPPGPLRHVPGTSFYPAESDTCMAWLDTRAPGSVLYVSFGSVASLSPRQLEEVALGIEDSKRPFLWAARDAAALLPEGFLDHTSARGLVVAWAPQAEILGHVAIGGFLTHCGWNSTLESIHMGVPMLCHPLSADQHLNALLITKVWGLGLSMQPTQCTLQPKQNEQEESIVGRGQVHEAIAKLMSSQELHVKAAVWKTKACHALEEGGSSLFAMEAIINDLKLVAR